MYLTWLFCFDVRCGIVCVSDLGALGEFVVAQVVVQGQAQAEAGAVSDYSSFSAEEDGGQRAVARAHQGEGPRVHQQAVQPLVRVQELCLRDVEHVSA